MSRVKLVLSAILLVLLGVGCARLNETPMPTPLPLDYIPTAVQLTLQAGNPLSASPSPQDSPASFPPVSPSFTPSVGISSSSPTSTVPVPTITQVGPSVSTQAQNSPTSVTGLQTTTPSPAPSTSTPTAGTPGVQASSTPRPTRTPSPTRTPTLPPAGVQINEPGPMSRVVSPLSLTGNIHTEPSGNYMIELWIEPLQPAGQPRMLYREVERMISNPIDWLYLDQKIQFELDRVSEFGQLRISVIDSFGRAAAINSVDLILLQMGTSDITQPMLKSDPLVIRSPFPNQLIQGGKVTVSGIAMPDQEYLHVQLVTADGKVVGVKDQLIQADPAGGYVPYSIDVPYSVLTPTWVRVQLYEINTRIAGTDHLSSVQILLSP